MLKKRWLWESIIVSVAFIVLPVVIKIVHGYYLTAQYVPDIVTQYSNRGYLEHQVSFGVISGDLIAALARYIGLLILVAAIYYGIRVLLSRFTRNDSMQEG